MNELVYVLSLEALIFGSLSIVLVAQRLDVFSWPADRTWPVLTSSLQVMLLNAQALLLVCCFVAAGRYSSFAPDVRDACARSSGRLATAAVLAAAYVAVLLMLRGSITECVLCQLLDTTCMDRASAPSSSAGFTLSHAAYLAVLIPVAALQAGLVVAAAGLCKEPRVVPRRVATVNCALLLAMQVQKTLENNASRLPTRCSHTAVSSIPPDTSPHVIILLMILCALDATADLFSYVVLNGSSSFHLPVLFSACRVASLAAPWSLHPLLDDGVVPYMLLLAHSALALLLAVLDIGDVWLAHFANTALRTTQTTPVSAQAQPAPAIQQPLQSHAPAFGTVTRPFAAFEVDPSRRRRFVLSFNNKARWPSQQTAKKTA